MSCFMMLRTFQHHWMMGVRFAFNCYIHCAKLLLLQPGNIPVILLIREGVTWGYHISMVLYGIALVLLAEELRDADPTLLSLLYANNVVFGRSARRSAVQLCLLMDQDPDRGYFPEPSKLIFITSNLEEKQAARREFERTVLHLIYVGRRRYLRAYLGTREKLDV